MAFSIGDISVGLKLDTRTFEGGAPAVAKLGQQLDLFRSPAAAAAAAMRSTGAELVATGGAAERATGHFELNNRVMARFAAIGVQEVVPSLQGSRLALENLLQPVLRLATGWTGLALAGVGLAGAVGYGLYKAFQDTQVVWKDSQGNLLDVTAALKQLDSEIGTSVQLLRVFKDAQQALTAPEAGFGLDLTGEGAAGLAVAGLGARVLGKRVSALRAQEQLRKQQKEAEASGFSEAGGLAAQIEKNAQGMTKTFLDLDKALKTFEASSAHLAITDPLQKMLILDYQATQDLITSYLKLIDVGDLAADKGRELIGRAGAAGGSRQISIRDTFKFPQGATSEDVIGFGGKGILAALDQIDKLNTAASVYEGNLKRMIAAGVSERDIQIEITKAQQNADATIVALNQQYADQPAILDLIRSKLGGLEFGGFARQLNEAAAGLGVVSRASVTLIDTGEGVQRTYVPALERAGIATSQFGSAMAGAVPQTEFLRASVVSVTGDVLALAQAFAFAAQEAFFLNAAVGSSANLGAAPLAAQ